MWVLAAPKSSGEMGWQRALADFFYIPLRYG
jgi:hypothetical protein